MNNRISNYTINKSDLEVLNQQVNEFVSNSVTSSAAKCSASSSTYTENQLGNIRVVGKGNKADIGIDTQQDSQLSLQCIQQSIQQTNIGNDIAQSIMNNLNQSVSADIMNKVVAAADSKMEQGMFSNPFAAASSKVNVDVTNFQQTETNRKLSNLISNSVENNVKTEDIKTCFTDTAQGISNKVGNIDIIGQENVLELNLSSKQISKSFSTCQQLTQQTSAVTNTIATQLGLAIVDDTKTKTSTETESIAKTSVKATGLEGVIGAIGGLFGLAALPAIISGCAIFCVCISCILIIFALKSGGKKSAEQQSEQTETEQSEKTE